MEHSLLRRRNKEGRASVLWLAIQCVRTDGWLNIIGEILDSLWAFQQDILSVLAVFPMLSFQLMSALAGLCSGSKTIHHKQLPLSSAQTKMDVKA